MNKLSLNLQQLDPNLNTTPQNKISRRLTKNADIIVQQASSMYLLTNN